MIDPVVAQNKIESLGLTSDEVTEKIYLSDEAERQWRTDFSAVATAGKLFVLMLAKHGKNVYVSNFRASDDQITIREDSFFDENFRDRGFFNFRGSTYYGYFPENMPSTLVRLHDDYASSYIDAESMSIYCKVNLSDRDYSDLNPYFCGCIERVTNWESMNDVLPSEDPGDFSSIIMDAATSMRQDKIDGQEFAVREAQTNLRRAETSLESMRKSFDELFKDGTDSEVISKQIDAIKKFPAVKNVRFFDNQLIVDTNMLDIGVTNKEYDGGRWKDVTIPLGEFEITFKLKEIIGDRFRTNAIKYINLTEFRKGSALIHPHILSPSDPCYSQWEENFIQSAQNVSVIGLVSNAINYLRTFAPDDPYGRHIHRFDTNRVFGGIPHEEQHDEDRIEFEDGDYERPGNGGDWDWYEPNYNGQWRDHGWEWFDHGVNGDDTRGEWRWYDEWDEYAGHFINGDTFRWYEDDDDYVQNDYGDWIHVDELEPDEEEEEVLA